MAYWQNLLSDPSWLFFGIGGWVVRVGAVLVIPFRRSPAAAKAWLLLIFFQPWLGLGLFLLVGNQWRSKLRGKRYKRLRDLYKEMLERFAERGASQAPAPVVDEAYANVVDLAERVGGLPLVSGNRIERLVQYDDLFTRLVQDIDAAKSHVHLLYYIFADDATTAPVLEALKRAAKRGVHCRLLVDAIGSRQWLRSLRKKLRPAGVSVRSSLPLRLDTLFATRPDLRNHRKIAVIDAAIGYTGSQNFIRADYQPPLVFEESNVRIEGPVVLELQATFTADWYLETGHKLDTDSCFPRAVTHGTMPAQMVPSRPDAPSSSNHRLIVALLHAARHSLSIVTPYFVPDEPVLHAMETAAGRGVRVRLIVPEQDDARLVGAAQRSFFEELLDWGVDVYLYRRRFLHAKFLLVDGKVVVVGSSNMDIRSFELNAEATLVVYDETLAASFEEEEKRLLEGSVPVSLPQWRERPLYQKTAQNIARLFSPVL